MKPIAAPIVGGMITSTIHVLILVPVFFVMIKARALRQGSSKVEKRLMCESALKPLNVKTPPIMTHR